MKIASLLIKSHGIETIVDFDAPQSLPENTIVVLTHLFTKTKIPDIENYSAVLEHYDVNGNFLLISVFYDTSLGSEVRVNGVRIEKDLLQFINTDLGLTNFDNQVWLQRIVNLEQVYSINEIQQKIEVANKSLGNSIPDIQVLAKLKETEEKIVEKEKLISIYQDYRKTKERLEKEEKDAIRKIDAYKTKISASEHLIKIIQKIDSEILKFGSLAKERNLKEKVGQIKTSRINKIINLLRNWRVNAGSLSDRAYMNENSAAQYQVYIFMLIAAQLGLSMLVYILTMNLAIIIISFGIFLLLVSLLLYLKLSLTSNYIQEATTVDYSDTNLTFEHIMGESDGGEEKFLIDAAWIQALIIERNKMISIINTNLEGQAYESFIQEMGMLEEGNARSKQTLVTIEKQKLTPEEYLKLRREVDILKIEKENLEEEKQESASASNMQLPFIFQSFSHLAQATQGELRKYIDVLREYAQVIVLNSDSKV